MIEEIKENTEYVPLKAKIGYTSLSMGSTILSGLGLGAIDIFYMKIYHIDLRIMALSWIIFSVWNAVNDPLLGIIEDRTKSKLGRRIPYLRYGAIPYTLAFILIWFPFVINSNFGLQFFQDIYPGVTGRDVGLFWNHVLMLFVFDTLFTMIGLIAYQLPAEMAITAQARSKIVLFSTMLGFPAMILPMILPNILLGGDNPSKEVFIIVMITVGIIGGIFVFLSSYLIKENKYTQMEEPLGFFESIRETFKNKAFLILEVWVFAITIIQEVFFTQITQLFDYVLVINDNIFIALGSAIIFILILIFGLKWMITNIPKYGIRKILMWASLMGIIGLSVILVFGLFYSDSKMPLELVILPIGFGFLGLVILMMNNGPIMSECVDYDEVKTGKRRETTYSGVNALLTKPAVSIAHFLTLMLMVSFGYVNDENISVSEQLPSVSTGVLLAFTLVPIIFLTIAIIALKFFPLDGEKWQDQKKQLQRTHIQKENDYMEHLKKKDLI
jgi:GPH family glycoside/pentoside/hexuronide:cation symporter